MAITPISQDSFSLFQKWFLRSAQSEEGDVSPIEYFTLQDPSIGKVRILAFDSEWIKMKVSAPEWQRETSGQEGNKKGFAAFCQNVIRVICLKQSISIVLPAFFEGLTHLDLSNNEITVLPEEGFSMLPSLEKLNLSNNYIATLKQGHWGGHEKNLCRLRKLDLSNNSIAALSPCVFEKLNFLEKLDLSYNKLANICEKAFSGLARLKELFLSENSRLHSFKGLRNLSNVRVLLLSHSNCEQLLFCCKSGLNFTGCKEMRCLDLSRNRIHTITSYWFVSSRFPYLQELNLSENHLTKIDNGLYQGLSQLRSLNLSNNHIVEMPSLSNLLHHWAQLEALDLSNNQLHQVIVSCSSPLGSCASLLSLNLSHNHLKYFPVQFPVPKLCKLDLSRNEIQIFTVNFFNNLTELIDLNISSNQLRWIQKNQFNALSKLTSLQLNCNQLSSLNKGCFNGLSQLSTLNLAHNKLHKLPAECVKDLTNLKTINLSFNQLKEMPERCFEGKCHLKTVQLSNNPITGTTSFFSTSSGTGGEKYQKYLLGQSRDGANELS